MLDFNRCWRNLTGMKIDNLLTQYGHRRRLPETRMVSRFIARGIRKFSPEFFVSSRVSRWWSIEAVRLKPVSIRVETGPGF